MHLVHFKYLIQQISLRTIYFQVLCSRVEKKKIGPYWGINCFEKERGVNITHTCFLCVHVFIDSWYIETICTHKYTRAVCMHIYILCVFTVQIKKKFNEKYICICQGLSSNSIHSTPLTRAPELCKIKLKFKSSLCFCYICLCTVILRWVRWIQWCCPQIPSSESVMDFSPSTDIYESCDSKHFSSLGWGLLFSSVS